MLSPDGPGLRAAKPISGDYIMNPSLRRRPALYLAAATVLAISWHASDRCLAQRQPFGFFVLQGIDKQNVRNSALRNRNVTGLSIRVSWSKIDKNSHFDWDWLDSQVKRCRNLDKPYMLRMMTGDNSPNWIDGPWHQGAPLPWSSAAQDALDQAVTALGRRYAHDPLLVGVHLSSTANNDSAEMHLAAGLTNLAGYTDRKVIDAWISAINSYATAFPNCALILNATIEPDHRGEITYPVIEHCQRRLGSRATFQHNSLKASTPLSARHHQLILDLGREGWHIGFQMVSGTSDRQRFGGSLQAAIELAPGASYFEIYQADVDEL
jgi:hypothetical protein